MMSICLFVCPFENSRWRTPYVRHIGNREIAISTKKSFDFDEIGWTADLELDDSQMTKYEKFRNLRWQMAVI